MARNFGTLLDDGPTTDTVTPVCQAAGCSRFASERLRDLRSSVHNPVYVEAWCPWHVPAGFPNHRRAEGQG